MKNNKQINAIIFNYNEITSCGVSPYSEKFLNAVSQKYKLAILSKKTLKGCSDCVEMKVLQNNEKGKFFRVISLNKTSNGRHYLQCAEKMYSNPGETIFIGQNSEDIKIANGYGFQTYFIQKGNSADESQNGENGQSIKKIKSLNELLTIL